MVIIDGNTLAPMLQLMLFSIFTDGLVVNDNVAASRTKMR